MPEVSSASVAAALWEERRLVRTWCMRGTLHLLTPEQHATYVAAVDRSVAGAWLRYFDLTQEDLDRVLAAVAESLDGEPMTRRELADAVGARLGAEWGDRLRSNWGELLKPAARRGVLVNGPKRGRRSCAPTCGRTGRRAARTTRAGSAPAS